MPEEKQYSLDCPCGSTFQYGEEDIYTEETEDNEQAVGIGYVRCPRCNARRAVGIEDEDDIEQTHTL